MRDYLIRRSLLIIVTLFLVSIIVFLTVRLIPGDIVDSMEAEARSWTAAAGRLDREAIERRLGLDVPWHVQYARWIGGIFQHGSLGVSLRDGRPVTEKILSRVAVTFELGLLALVTSVIIALPIGIYSAVRQDSWGDYLGRAVAITGLSTPNFWLATMVVIFPAIWWGWSPSMQYIPFTEDPLGNLLQFFIPSLILGTAMSAMTMRMTRTMMLEVLRQDYIRTAWSKGLKERVVVGRHALKNALIPVVTIVGTYLPIMIGGAIIMEQIFALPGMGRLMITALQQRDYTVVSGVNLVIATTIVVVNLVVDISYAYLDPRVRYG